MGAGKKMHIKRNGDHRGAGHCPRSAWSKSCYCDRQCYSGCRRMLNFDIPYLHDPSKNLLVIMINQTGDYSSDRPEFAVYTGQDQCSVYDYRDNSEIIPAINEEAYHESNKNSIRFIGNNAAVYNIYYNENITGGGISKALGLINEPTLIQGCSLTQEQYYFTGWNTEADGSGTSYAPGDTVTCYSNLTLYAQWAKKKCLTFKANGGKGEDSFQLFIPNTPIQLEMATFYKPGYQLFGWNTESDGSGTDYSLIDPVTLNDNLTLYAQWEYLDGYIQTGNLYYQNSINCLPFYPGYPHSYSEQIYTADEIGGISTISQLGFYVLKASSGNGWTGEIYLADTDLDQFTTGNSSEMIGLEDTICSSIRASLQPIWATICMQS